MDCFPFFVYKFDDESYISIESFLTNLDQIVYNLLNTFGHL